VNIGLDAVRWPKHDADRHEWGRRIVAKPSNLKDYSALRRAIEAARPKGTARESLASARGLLLSWVQAAETHGVPFSEALRRIRSGAAARQISGAAAEAQTAAGQGIAAEAACAPGCAFCCILRGDDGGTISADEAETLHAALIDLRGEPDGRSWHPDACASLDPKTRMCRVYGARPMICRTYMSVDVSACEKLVEGTPSNGTGVLGAQAIHMSLLALSRAVLLGRSMVQTYSMSTIARMAVEGASLDDALAAARHGPKGLVEELERLASARK